MALSTLTGLIDWKYYTFKLLVEGAKSIKDKRVASKYLQQQRHHAQITPEPLETNYVVLNSNMTDQEPVLENYSPDTPEELSSDDQTLELINQLPTSELIAMMTLEIRKLRSRQDDLESELRTEKIERLKLQKLIQSPSRQLGKTFTLFVEPNGDMRFVPI